MPGPHCVVAEDDVTLTNQKPDLSPDEPISADLHLLSKSARQNLHRRFSLEHNVDNEITIQEIILVVPVSTWTLVRFKLHPSDQTENDSVQETMMNIFPLFAANS